MKVSLSSTSLSYQRIISIARMMKDELKQLFFDSRSRIYPHQGANLFSREILIKPNVKQEVTALHLKGIK